jgi:hypothetical protein
MAIMKIGKAIRHDFWHMREMLRQFDNNIEIVDP